MDPTKSTQCPRCHSEVATFLHLAWQCPEVNGYWQRVVERVQRTTNTLCPMDPRIVLLGGFTKTKEKKMQYKFTQLLLILAKRRVAISWMGLRVPQIEKWEGDVREWALAEEVRLRKCRHDEKLEEELKIWKAFLDKWKSTDDARDLLSLSALTLRTPCR